MKAQIYKLLQIYETTTIIRIEHPGMKSDISDCIYGFYSHVRRYANVLILCCHKRPSHIKMQASSPVKLQPQVKIEDWSNRKMLFIRLLVAFFNEFFLYHLPVVNIQVKFVQVIHGSHPY